MKVAFDKETFLKAWDSVQPINRLSNSQVINSFIRPDKAKQRIVIELNVKERLPPDHEARNVIDISGLKK